MRQEGLEEATEPAAELPPFGASAPRNVCLRPVIRRDVAPCIAELDIKAIFKGETARKNQIKPLLKKSKIFSLKGWTIALIT